MGYDECSVCGVTSNEVKLLDVVSFKEKGVVKVCDSCARKENMPVLRRPTTFQLKESEKESPRVYDRLSAARIREKGRFGSIKRQEEKKEESLRDIVEKNYRNRVSSESKEKPRKDLIDNFHWVIMRARRARKMTPEQLAKEISESVSAIKMAEKGILPEDDHKIVNKIESFLSIKIIKDEAREKMIGVGGEGDKEKRAARVIKFDPKIMENLTIDDLRNMKEAKEGKEKSREVARDQEDLDKDFGEDFKEVFGESESEEESEK